MSPAGAGVRSFRAHTNTPYACTVLAVIALAVGVLLIPGSQPPARAAARAAALSPAWNGFQADCTAGPAPGQGSTPSACVCWEGQLQAEAIQPAYAVDALDAAQVGGGAAYTVGENLSGGPVGSAMAGCGLYQQTAG